MSEIKGQLLGMVLTLAVFGTILGVLLPAFKTAANDVSGNIKADASGGVNFTERTSSKVKVTL